MREYVVDMPPKDALDAAEAHFVRMRWTTPIGNTDTSRTFQIPGGCSTVFLAGLTGWPGVTFVASSRPDGKTLLTVDAVKKRNEDAGARFVEEELGGQRV